MSTDSARSHSFGTRGTVLAVAALIVFTLALHGSALRGWWLYDDPQLVLEAKRQSLAAMFFDPGEYTHLAAHTFVPLQLVSFKLDQALRPGSARFAYAHQLAALTLAVVLLFFVLRQHVDDPVALIGAALFAASWAATYAARTLMIRHYVEGLVLALAALALWRKRPLAATCFYFLALLAKEVYAPLPLLFLLGLKRDEWRRMLAPLAAFALFMVWRWRMTGLVGGYAEFPSAAALRAFPRALWEHLHGPTPYAWVWAAATLAIVALWLYRERARGLAFVAVMLVAGVAPVIAVAANFEWRYSFAFVAVMVSMLTIASTRPILLGILLVAAFAAHGEQQQMLAAQTRDVEAEGRYVFTQPPAAPPLYAHAPEWYHGGLEGLRGTPGPRYFCSSVAYLAGEVTSAVTVQDGRIVPFAIPDEWHKRRGHVSPWEPLSVRFALAHHDASWSLGPAGREFAFVTVPGYTEIPIPPQGSRRVPAARTRQFFLILRTAPDGQLAMSPVLPVPQEGETTIWSRP